MLDKDNVIEKLHALGLTTEESRLYLELLKTPSTHLKLAHATGINRTKIYRLASDLERRSLVSRRTDDRGTFLVAADPATLEVGVVNTEEIAQKQREALGQVLPVLESLKTGEASNFVVHTYEGTEGFKQMLWHELKAKDTQLIFGSGTIEDLVSEGDWAEKHRAMTVEMGYSIKELLNPGEKKDPFTLNKEFTSRYTHRYLPKDILLLGNQTTIYNNTVTTYHWRDQQKVGFEIINKAHAQMMRQMFEHYWTLAEPIQ